LKTGGQVKYSLTALVPVIAVLSGGTTFIWLIVYTLLNGSGHTSINPYSALTVFVPVATVGIITLLLRRKWKLPLLICIATVAVGCAGILLLVYLDRSNSLLQYEVWLNRGMP
jgi:hypothetical protein